MIKGIFYSQFDNILGPKIVSQIPDNLLSPELFDSISDYIITKPSLSGRLTCIHVQDLWILGVPMCLSHTKYPRNALLFNMGFVVDARDPQVAEYKQSLEQALLKLAHYLTVLERETEYLFRQTGNNTAPFSALDRSSTASAPPLSASALTLLSSPLLERPNSADVRTEPTNVPRRGSGGSSTPPVSHSPTGEGGSLLHSSGGGSLISPLPLRRDLASSTIIEKPANNADAAASPAVCSAVAVVSNVPQSPLPTVMKSIFTSINAELACTVQVDAANAIYLRLFPSLADLDPSLPQAHHVPVPIADLSYLFPQNSENSFWNLASEQNSKEWDLALQKIIPYLDGVNYVKKIAFDANISIEIVTKALQHLLYYDCILLIDIFQYANMYTTTPHIRKLYKDKSLQRACVMAVTDDPTRPMPNAMLIFQLYSHLQPGVEMKDFLQVHNIASLNIDLRRFITFGLVNRLIRRLHKYPTSIAAHHPTRLPHNNLLQFTDGNHTYDEIAVATGMSYAELEAYFDKAIYR